MLKSLTSRCSSARCCWCRRRRLPRVPTARIWRASCVGIAALYMIGRAAEARRGQPCEVGPGPWRRHDDASAARAPAARIPGNCGHAFGHRGSGGQVLDKACVERSVAQPGRLPQACARSLLDRYGRREVFSTDCLEREGWRIEARRR